MCFWVGSGSDALWAVDFSESSAKVILDSENRPYPIVRLLYRPANTNGPFTYRTIERVNSIPNVSVGSGSGCYSSSAGDVGGVRGYWVYLIYDYESDVIYVPRVVNTPLQNSIFTEFQKSFVYKSYFFLRNPPDVVLSPLTFKEKFLQQAIIWMVVALSVGATFWLAWSCYKTADELLWSAHKNYVQAKNARYIDEVMKKSGGDPLGGTGPGPADRVKSDITFPPP